MKLVQPLFSLLLIDTHFNSILSPTLASQYMTLQNSSIDAYTDINDDVHTLDKHSNQAQDDLILQNLYLNRLSNVAARLSYNNGDSLHIEALDSIIGIKISAIENNLDQLNAWHLNKVTLLDNAINQLPTDYHKYNKLKEVYQLSNFGNDAQFQLNAQQQVTLLDIANECPLVYGNAVYLAQDVLVSENLNEYDDFNMDCTDPSNRSTMTVEPTNFNPNIAPNPTANSITITSVEKLSSIKGYRTDGTKIFEKELSGRTSQIDLSTYPIKQSLLLLEILDVNKQRVIKKVFFVR